MEASFTERKPVLLATTESGFSDRIVISEILRQYIQTAETDRICDKVAHLFAFSSWFLQLLTVICLKFVYEVIHATSSFELKRIHT